MGCLPVLPRFFQRLSRKTPTSPSNRNTTSAGGHSWWSGSCRGYFSVIWSRSESLNSSDTTPRRPSYGFSSFGTKRSESSAPRNSRASFSDTLLPMDEIHLPQVLLPAGGRVTHSTPRMTTSEDRRWSLGRKCNVDCKPVGISVTKEVLIEHSIDDDSSRSSNPWDCIDPGDPQNLRKL